MCCEAVGAGASSKKIAELRPEKHREFALSKGMDSRRLVNIRFDQFSWKIGPRGSFHSEGLSWCCSSATCLWLPFSKHDRRKGEEQAGSSASLQIAEATFFERRTWPRRSKVRSFSVIKPVLWSRVGFTTFSNRLRCNKYDFPLSVFLFVKNWHQEITKIFTLFSCW